MDKRIKWAGVAIVSVMIVASVVAVVWEVRRRRRAAPPGRRKVESAPEAELIRSPLLGGKGGGRFEDHRANGLLIGFKLTRGRYGPGVRVVRAVRPVFRTPTGVKMGPVRGSPSSRDVTSLVLAKEGYAVGGVSVRWGHRIDAIKITFMRVNRGLLDTRDTYATGWYGGEGGDGPKRLGCDGKPVIGIHGRCGAELDAIGLVQSPAPVHAEPVLRTPEEKRAYALVQQFDALNLHARGEAVEQLLAMAAEHRDVVVSFLLQALEEPFPEKQAAAAEALERIDSTDEKVAAALIAAVRAADRGSPVTRAAIPALGGMGAAAKGAVPMLTKLLDGDDRPSRLAAAKALGQIGPAARSALPILREAQASRDKELSEAAVEALRRVLAPARPPATAPAS